MVAKKAKPTFTESEIMRVYEQLESCPYYPVPPIYMEPRKELPPLVDPETGGMMSRVRLSHTTEPLTFGR